MRRRRSAGRPRTGHWSFGKVLRERVDNRRSPRKHGVMVSGAVGRTTETRAIVTFLDRAAISPSALFLEGEAGIGKTTVWLVALEHARATIESLRPEPRRPSPCSATVRWRIF